MRIFFLKLFYLIFSKYDLCMHCKYLRYGKNEIPCNNCNNYNKWKENNGN